VSISFYRRFFRPALILAALTIAAVAVPAAAMSGQTPEHVSDAYKALTAGKPSAVAAADLHAAIGDQAEPAKARADASGALAALTQGGRALATDPAMHGAAVEHFTYALRALNAGDLTGTGSASDHLTDALALPEFHQYAQTALSAISAHNVRAAKAAARAGLHAAVTAP
jgi:hypothetical protein